MNVYTLDAAEIADLRDDLIFAALHGNPVRVAIDGGLKVDDGTGWSAPMGTDTTGRS
jgi:hypothetical protein